VRSGPFRSGWTKRCARRSSRSSASPRPSSRWSCAPHAGAQVLPGQFYRVHNLETLAPTVEGTALASEGLALTGAWVDKERGLISLIALEMGSSSRLCAPWKPGDPLVVMGVTGAPTDIPSGKTVMLLGGGLGNAVLFSIGKALRAAGNQVIYFAGYRNRHGVFKVAEIEAASDVIVVRGPDPGRSVHPGDPSPGQEHGRQHPGGCPGLRARALGRDAHPSR
jgi:NAD(P)H-flavin reductase